jgi:lysophospholipase L1-like esterase
MDIESPTKHAKGNRPLRFRIVACILVVCLVAVVGLGGYLYFNLYLPIGSGQAGPDVPAEPFRSVWSERKVMLLGIGDSVTAGFGVPKGYCYFDRLMKNPETDSNDMFDKNLSKVLPNLIAKNMAISGSTSLEHVEKQINRLKPQPADVFGVVVMTTGGNDLIHNYGRTPPAECAMYGATLEQARPWIANFENRLDGMIADVEKSFPGGCRIFLANIYDPTDETGARLASLACPNGRTDWQFSKSITIVLLNALKSMTLSVSSTCMMLSLGMVLIAESFGGRTTARRTLISGMR